MSLPNDPVSPNNEANMSIPNDLVSPNDDKTHDDYSKRRSYWERIGAENIKLLDEQLVFLSSGALIFSISVVDLLGPYYNFWWLFVIWTLFTLSLLCRLFSCVTGGKNAEEKIKILDQNMNNHREGKSPYKHDRQNDTIFQPLTKVLNCSALVLFVLGVITFFIYACTAAHFKNTQKIEKRSTKMSNQQSNEGQQKNSRQLATYQLVNQGSFAPVQRPSHTNSVATGTKGNPGSTAPIQRPTTPVSPPPTK